MSTESSTPSSSTQDTPKFNAAFECDEQRNLRVSIVTMATGSDGESRPVHGATFYADEEAASAMALLKGLQNFKAVAEGDDTYCIVYVQVLGEDL